MLLIFVKNLLPGRVKTRLAAGTGQAEALHIYRLLLAHTRRAAAPLPGPKRVCYSDYLAGPDEWSAGLFQKTLQHGPDLGARMHHAFTQAFAEGHAPVVIIGSDCPGLTTGLLQEAFRQLRHHDLAVGPARDGGYYLLGMNRLHAGLFENKAWSTDTVLTCTLADAAAAGLSVFRLPECTDVDTAADWAETKHLLD